jgi:hypothetical protein
MKSFIEINDIDNDKMSHCTYNKTEEVTLTMPFSFLITTFASSTIFIMTNTSRRLLPEYLSYITY